jgi:hypothetical protein
MFTLKLYFLATFSKAGDTVVLVKRVDAQWLMGKVGDKEGLFPQNFVDIIHPLHDEVRVVCQQCSVSNIA